VIEGKRRKRNMNIITSEGTHQIQTKDGRNKNITPTNLKLALGLRFSTCNLE